MHKPAGNVGTLSMKDAKACVDMLKRQPSVILELAATIHWLRCKEAVSNWRGRTENP